MKKLNASEASVVIGGCDTCVDTYEWSGEVCNKVTTCTSDKNGQVIKKYKPASSSSCKQPGFTN